MVQVELARLLARHELLRQELEAAHRLISAMVCQAGGQVFLSDRELAFQTIGTFETYRDTMRRGIVIRTVKPVIDALAETKAEA